MVKNRGTLAILVGLGLAAGVFLSSRDGGLSAPLAGAAPEATRSRASGDEFPRIDLARLEAGRAEAPAGSRNVFDFGQAPPIVTDATPPPVTLAADATPPADAATPPPGPPPLNVKYIGSIDTKQGLRVAVLLTDRKEVLTGQVGEVVANRIKIVKIGFESVDVQDVGSDRVRRIPLKGN